MATVEIRLTVQEILDLLAYNEKCNPERQEIRIARLANGDIVAGWCDEDFEEETTHMIREAD